MAVYKKISAMAEDELKAVKKSIEELDNLCRTFERSPEFNDVLHPKFSVYQSWQERLAALQKEKIMLLAQQQSAGEIFLIYIVLNSYCM